MVVAHARFAAAPGSDVEAVDDADDTVAYPLMTSARVTTAHATLHLRMRPGYDGHSSNVPRGMERDVKPRGPGGLIGRHLGRPMTSTLRIPKIHAYLIRDPTPA